MAKYNNNTVCCLVRCLSLAAALNRRDDDEAYVRLSSILLGGARCPVAAERTPDHK